MGFLIVFIGGGIGSAIRHGVNIGIGRLLGGGFPYATSLINVTGSFIMGLVAAYFAFKGDATQSWRLFLTTGILGGFTTFSSFALDATLLWQRHQVGSALVYTGASLLFSIAGLVAGMYLLRTALA